MDDESQTITNPEIFYNLRLDYMQIPAYLTGQEVINLAMPWNCGNLLLPPINVHAVVPPFPKQLTTVSLKMAD